MSEPINDGGPAFPEAGYSQPNGSFAWPISGMSLRVWLAGQAIAGLCAGSNLDVAETIEYAVEIADAVLAKLSKPKQ